jgi:CheY-like chemotaxis protein
MLIDDDQDDNMIHQVFLEESGIPMVIQVYDDPTKALESLNNKSSIPNLILLDINMPKLNGFEFLQQLDTNVLERVYVILLSTNLDSVDQKKARQESGVEKFWSKPLPIKEFEELYQKRFV